MNKTARSAEIDAATQITGVIEDHLNIPLKQEHLSRLAGIPRRNLRRELLKATGMTPYQYLLKARVKEAARIIDEEPTAHPIDIARRVGFPSVGALVRKFKREQGCTIEEYRSTILQHGARPALRSKV